MSSACMTGRGRSVCEDASEEIRSRSTAVHIDSLVAAEMLARRLPASFDARAEDEYHGGHARPPHAGLRLLGPIATVAGLILLVVGIA